LYGKHKWGGNQNQRTIEGSLAMWLSMMVSGGMTCCHTSQEFVALVVATTFTTWLEACTTHLDNLVLPLAGSTILLLML
jgi:dolichol kinase